MIIRIPVRVRIGCSVTTIGEIDVDQDAPPSSSFAQLADVLEVAAQDARRHAERPEEAEPWQTSPEATGTG